MTEAAPQDRNAGTIQVRLAHEGDLGDLESMIDDFVEGHPAEHHSRPSEAMRAAYFGRDPVAELVVAERQHRVVGMAQWIRIHDMFWGMFGGRADWLYVKPEARGLGVSAALLAKVCERIREAGGAFLYGQGNAQTGPFYERAAIAGPEYRDFHLGGEAFQQIADLSGLPLRQIVQRLPQPELNHAPAGTRDDSAR